MPNHKKNFFSQTFADFNKTEDGWLVWKENQYYISYTSKAMEDARHHCKQRHADLVIINSEAERIFLWKQVGTKIRSSLLYSAIMALQLRITVIKIRCPAAVMTVCVLVCPFVSTDSQKLLKWLLYRYESGP